MSFAITQHAYISKFVLVSLTLFQSTNINTSLLQTGIKLYLQLYFTSALLLTFKRCSIKVNVQKSRQSHLPVFWKFSIQNLGKSPKSLHTTSEWMNSYCHRLFSLCPLFHFCWKWGVRHSPSFAIPQLSPTLGLHKFECHLVFNILVMTLGHNLITSFRKFPPSNIFGSVIHFFCLNWPFY